MAKKTRTIEMYRGWDDNTWDTDWIEIPADTPEEKQKSVVIANNVLNQSRNLGYMSTRWQKAEDKILRAAADNLIVQLM